MFPRDWGTWSSPSHCILTSWIYGCSTCLAGAKCTPVMLWFPMRGILFSLEYKYRVSATTFAMPPLYIPFTFSQLSIFFTFVLNNVGRWTAWKMQINSCLLSPAVLVQNKIINTADYERYHDSPGLFFYSRLIVKILEKKDVSSISFPGNQLTVGDKPSAWLN